VETVAIRLGFQIPNFSYGTGAENLFPTVIAQAREAEAAGYDSLFVMDHFYQLPMLGTPDQPMLEAYTALGALATATERLQLGTLVTGNTYRNPTLLAKIITTLDVVSAGRAVLGLGAGWYELEHRQLGFEFGTFTDRFPILIGGSGEKKTFGIAARYADHVNIIAAFDELPRKVDALRARCEEVGRDPATLETSLMLTVVFDENAKADQVPEQMSGRMAIGGPAQIAEQVQAKVLDAGVGGAIVNIPNGHEPGVITAVAEALRPLLGL
jgi:alkanesulfonate monooxygenase SsuD/methylene tetrahydromethanopterin reductase-like flavin-dependent oxidoreductase (luciferase family)